ncbi:MAG: ROK family protein [Micromonosporaceae bacterium]|nr:ROK family protein [Micromonosporaceae bacterium]
MSPRGQAPDTARPTTLGRALMLVHTGYGVRSELTDRLGLTRTATGTVLRDLEHLRLVRTIPGPRPERGGTGRPSHRVEIHPDAPVALGVQVHYESVALLDVGLGGVAGQIVEHRLPRPATPEAVLGLVADLVAARLATASKRCVGLGLALPSAVAGNGTALAALHLNWPVGVPVASITGDLLAARGHRIPVLVGNDANLAALAEHRHGAGAGASDLLYVTTGQCGVGGGLVLDGRLHTGSAGYALEVGHIPVRPGGRPCHCGSLGCLDVEADPSALLAEAGLPTPEPIMPAARALVAASASDPAARAAVLAVTRRLAAGLASLVNVFNPDRVVLGGLHADLLAVAAAELRDEVARRSYLDQAARVPIVAGRLAQPGLLGAAEVALQPLLDDPRTVLRQDRSAHHPEYRPQGTSS